MFTCGEDMGRHRQGMGVMNDMQPTNDASEIARLAALNPLEYDREREAAAKKLGVRVAALDDAVAARRKPCKSQREASAPSLPTPDPWPEPVNGAEFLTSIADAVRAYIVAEPAAADAVALWAVHTHALDAFAITPRLAVTAAEKRSGKTTLLDLLGCIVARPLSTANATAPAIFRTIESLAPTL